MQERFLPLREERLRELIRLVEAAHEAPRRLLDLGCGTGSVTRRLIDAFPGAEVVGVDLDPTLLALARARCAREERARFLLADLRYGDLLPGDPGNFDAAVSATALHWLTPGELEELYARLFRILGRGGIFLNADHVGSSIPGVAERWRASRKAVLPSEGEQKAAWDSFFDSLLLALGPTARSLREKALGPFRGSEEGYPLEFHADALRRAGFQRIDCFWRWDGDAIYGGVVPDS